MSKTLFISRKISFNSPFHTLSEKYDLTLVAQELMTFELLPFSVPKTQWLFFYSRKGVEFFRQIANLNGYKLAAFASKTADFIREISHNDLEFVGDGKAISTAIAFAEVAKSDSVCFVHGKNSLRSVQKQFKDKIQWIAAIAYDQKINQDLILSHYDLAILTSPMNVQAFTQSNGSASHYFSIGKTTSGMLKKMNMDSLVADHASEESLCKLLEEFLNRK